MEREQLKNRILYLRERRFNYAGDLDLREENDKQLELLEKLYEALYG